MIRIAAAGDLHYLTSSAGKLRPHLEGIEEKADFLLLAGDLTQTGTPEEARILASDLSVAPIPTIAVFGNHDYHSNCENEVRRILEGGGIRVLEKEYALLTLGGRTVGIVGMKGFGGGFMGACGCDFGEPEMKAFVRHTKQQARALCECLEKLKADHCVVLLHYSPVPDTLLGEPKEIYPFLGSY